MPLSFRIDTTKCRVYLTGTGMITARDFFATQGALTSDPTFAPTHSMLADLTSAEVEISSPEMVVLAQRTVFDRSARRAVVVRLPVLVGLTRTFELLAGVTTGEMEIFAHSQTAERWLDGGYDAG
jgi:hypothetical protein